MKKSIPQGKFGWICPICGTAYSPEVKTCRNPTRGIQHKGQV